MLEERPVFACDFPVVIRLQNPRVAYADDLFLALRITTGGYGIQSQVGSASGSKLRFDTSSESATAPLAERSASFAALSRSSVACQQPDGRGTRNAPRWYRFAHNFKALEARPNRSAGSIIKRVYRLWTPEGFTIARCDATVWRRQAVFDPIGLSVAGPLPSFASGV